MRVVTLRGPHRIPDSRVAAAGRSAYVRPSAHDVAIRTPPTPATCAPACRGVRALLLDLDGVIVLKSELLPGAAEALARLDAAGVPVCHRHEHVAGQPGDVGRLPGEGRRLRPAGPDRQRRVRGGGVRPAPLRRPAGVRAGGSGRAAGVRGAAAALPRGGGGGPGRGRRPWSWATPPEDFTPANVQSAFRLLRGGARFVAMHKNRWWLTPAGELLDAGAYVVGLEYATERRALVTGKPARAFFAEGVRRLGELRRPLLWRAARWRWSATTCWNDIRGAQRAGLRGVLVRTGKHGDADLARFCVRARRRCGRTPWRRRSTRWRLRALARLVRPGPSCPDAASRGGRAKPPARGHAPPPALD